MTTSLWEEKDSEAFLRYADHFVPDRPGQLAAVAAMAGPVTGTVLDLCCGGGALSAHLLTERPDCRVVGLDASPTMLVEARRRLAGHGTRFTTEEFDLGAADWRTRSEPVAAVVSSLAVHHLDGPGKRQLFRDVHRMLAPGGAFVLADLVQPVGRRAHELARRGWNDWVRDAGGETAHQAFHALKWSCFDYPDDLDKPSPLPDQLGWLADAGFVEVDVWWARAGHAVYGGVTPEAGA